MKYYIPTTILNFGNILSTDSISPVAFYNKRNFGSPHWKKIGANAPENILVLYSSPFSFSLETNGQENRPMFVAIESEEEFQQIGKEAFVCNHTIYFDWNTNFVFLSKEDLKVACSLAQISDSAKMYCLYRDKRMIIHEVDNLCADNTVIDELPIDMKYIDNDFRINKIKGFLYGYYVGGILTCRPQDVGSIRSLKQVYAKIASILSSFSFEGKPSEELLKYEDEVKGCIIEAINEQNKVNKVYSKPIDTSRKEIVIKDLRVDSINNIYIIEDCDKELFISWINNILCDRKWGRIINTVKSLLADELTKDAIRVYGTQRWESSSTRVFLNDLRHSLAGDYFHQEWDNGMLSSLAAFLMRGDDWKDMLEFMQSKGMYDYRLAFGLYGSWTGFASIPTDFTDLLFSQDKKYVKTVCDEFYQQIFGMDIPPLIKHEEMLRDKVLKIWNNMPSNLKKDEKKKKGLESALNEIGMSQNSEQFLQILSKQTGWKTSKHAKYFIQNLSGLFKI